MTAASTAPFLHLLLTNNPPLPHEAIPVRDYLSVKRNELSELNTQIEKLQRSGDLQLLFDQKAMLLGEIVAAESIISPFRCLPDELIEKIILEACDADEYNEVAGAGSCVPIRPYSIMDCRSGPWIYGKVCRWWRTVVESLSSLWNKIDLDWDQVRKCQHPGDILRSVLRRTNSSPLYIYISSYDDEHSDNERVQLVEPLLSTADRWYELRMNLPLHDDSWWTTQLKGLAAGSFPALRRLCISQSVSFLPSAAVEIFRSAMSIQKYYMTLQYGHVVTTSSYLPCLPWTGLTHFGWEDPMMVPELYCDLFRNLPNVVDVEIHGYEAGLGSHFEQRIAAIPVITLPQVHALRVFSFDFLPVLRLPALETVEILEKKPRSSTIFDKFESCVLQSECSIKSLLLSCLYDKMDIYLRNCAPSLTTLDIETDSRFQFNNFVSALTIVTEASSPSQVVLPNLETLSVRYREGPGEMEPINIDGIAQMVESRWKVVYPAVRQLASFYHLLEEEGSLLEDELGAHPTIERLKEEGLEITLLRKKGVF